jgi:Uma2 family endonuclease
LISASDDGIVVGMTTNEYLHSYETNRRRELVHGVVREPPSPFFSHQEITLKVARALADHIEGKGLGKIGIAPIDVVLNTEGSLIVQPDVLFVAAERLRIIRRQVWGPPDLVVEVLSLSTASYDRGEKLEWYRQYGVREYWLVDPGALQLTVISFASSPPDVTVLSPPHAVRSLVLPEFDAPVHRLMP